MKICIKCKEEKQLINFAKSKQNKDGFTGRCKICIRNSQNIYNLNNKEKLKECKKLFYLNNKERYKIKSKEYQLNNKEKLKEYNKEYQVKNKERIKKINREYRLKNQGYLNDYNKKRKLVDPLFKLRCNISSRITQSIKNNGYTKKSISYEILGCSFEDFKQHLEKQFTKGMSWENQGEWHLDHIYPVSLAKDEKHLIKLNHYTNFQPLWAVDNLKKGNKIIEKQLILI